MLVFTGELTEFLSKRKHCFLIFSAFRKCELGVLTIVLKILWLYLSFVTEGRISKGVANCDGDFSSSSNEYSLPLTPQVGHPWS